MMKKLNKFNNVVLKNYKKKVKAIWLVPNKQKDDYCMLMDNIMFPMSKRKFDLEMSQLKEKHKVDINVKMYGLTTYFKDVTMNNLDILSEMESAVPIYDPDGFFTPLKTMVEDGQVLGTQESIARILDNVKERFKIIEGYKKQILFNSYKAVLDAACAALIARNYSVPVQTELPKALKNYFVKKKILEKVYVSICGEIINKYKAFEHGNLSHISGKELGELHNGAFAFVERMKTLVGKGF